MFGILATYALAAAPTIRSIGGDDILLSVPEVLRAFSYLISSPSRENEN
jgi:hypothetical protein